MPTSTEDQLRNANAALAAERDRLELDRLALVNEVDTLNQRIQAVADDYRRRIDDITTTQAVAVANGFGVTVAIPPPFSTAFSDCKSPLVIREMKQIEVRVLPRIAFVFTAESLPTPELQPHISDQVSRFERSDRIRQAARSAAEHYRKLIEESLVQQMEARLAALEETAR